MRYSKQKGLLPSILFLVGLFIHLLFVGGTIPYLISGSIQIMNEGSSLSALWSLAEFVFGMIGLVWSIPSIAGSFFICAFPNIKITEDGIEYCSYRIFRSVIKWGEIDNIKELSNGYKAITISRQGFALVNGLYSNKIYGDIVKSNLPVILISPRLENLQLLIHEIDKHLPRHPASKAA